MDTGLTAAALSAGAPPTGTTNRAGWQNGEEAFLFSEVARGRAAGLPLKAVFERVAAQTGRKPNSIRNYYYARVKESGMAASEAFHSAAFVPFSEEEMRALLRTVLAEQAKGISVRACTLNMGKGDTKTMLRYQNKYRSLIRTNPEFVQKVRAELEAEGIPAFNPYALESPRRSAKRQQAGGAASLANEAAETLAGIKGIDAEAFLVRFPRLRRQLRDTKPSRKLRGSEHNAQSCASGLPCRTMRLPRSGNGSASYLRCSVR